MTRSARGGYASARRTPPWLVERMVERIGPPAKKTTGCRIPMLAVLGAVFVIILCLVLSFWTGARPGSNADTEATDAALVTPSPHVSASRTPVPVVPTAPLVVATPPGKAGATATPAKYRVQSGDTLGAIAAKNGVTVQDIMDANNLSTNLLHVGDELVIPRPSAPPK